MLVMLLLSGMKPPSSSGNISLSRLEASSDAERLAAARDAVVPPTPLRPVAGSTLFENGVISGSWEPLYSCFGFATRVPGAATGATGAGVATGAATACGWYCRDIAPAS